jgi:uncharacterized protein YjdB
MANATVTINPLPAPISGPTAVCAGTTITLTESGSGSWNSSNTAVATIGSSTGIVTGIVTGTSIIDYTLPTGCSVTTVVTVSPAPSAIGGPASVCSGSSSSLTDLVPGGLWSSSNVAIATVGSLSGLLNGVTTGTVTVTYSLGASCTVTRTETISPTPAVITGGSSVCIGSTSLFTDVTPGGIWACSPGTIASISGTGMVTGITAGVATISYTSGSCSSVKSLTVNTSPVPITGFATVCVRVGNN